MNLAKNPTHNQLRSLLYVLDHNQATHVLYVKKNGDVCIVPLEENESPISLFEKNKDEIQFQIESFAIGTDWVGQRAAYDYEWVEQLLNQIQFLWDKKAKGKIVD